MRPRTYSDSRLWKWVALQREVFEAALKYMKAMGVKPALKCFFEVSKKWAFER